jgi:hypothetical protein
MMRGEKKPSGYRERWIRIGRDLKRHDGRSEEAPERAKAEGDGRAVEYVSWM